MLARTVRAFVDQVSWQYEMNHMIWTEWYGPWYMWPFSFGLVDETSEAQTEGEDVEIGKEQRFGVNFENEAVVTYKKSSVSGICSQSGVFIVCMLKRQWWFLFVLNSSCWWLICLKKCLFLSYCALKKTYSKGKGQSDQWPYRYDHFGIKYLTDLLSVRRSL